MRMYKIREGDGITTTIQKQAFSQDNIVDDHLWLFNTILGETFKEIATYLKNRNIQFGHLPDFLINPQRYPGNKTIGLRLITEKFLEDIVSKHYFEIQAKGLPVKFVYHTLIKALFQKGMEFTPTSQITMATRGGDDARKTVSTSRIDEPPRLIIIKNKFPKIKSKTKSKSKKKIISKKKKKQVTTSKRLCAYCGAKVKQKATRNTTHINMFQNPTHHRFCSKECKIAWIFGLNEINEKTSQEVEI